MDRKILIAVVSLILAGLALAACTAPGAQGDPETQATALPPVVSDVGIVAEGRLVPQQSVELAFAAGGRLAEVLVEEGEQVQAGEVIARLGDREPLESNVAAAEMELLSARQELLAAEEALQALYDDLPEAQTQALQAVTDARKELYDAQRSYNGLNSSPEPIDVDAAWANVVLAQEKLDDAKDDYEPYEKKSQDNVIRAALLNRLAEVQNAYDDAVRRYNNLNGVYGSDFDIQQADTRLQIAEARLAQAQSEADKLVEGPDAAEVSLAQSRVETAQGRITAAEAALEAAQAALADLDLTATIDGTVVDNELIAGQQITTGAPVVQLADLSQWIVETDNLTELDVVSIAPGQGATITPDALPEVELRGTVESISDVYEDKRGDVTYTARLALETSDPRLRWGMTMAIVFEEE